MNKATLLLIGQVLDAADILATIVMQFKGNEDKIRQLIAEDRDPTPEEWSSLQSVRDDNTDIIENA